MLKLFTRLLSLFILLVVSWSYGATVVQRLDGLDAQIAGKVLAKMDDCENNWVGVPQDKDVCYDTAIDHLLYYDATDSVWRCTSESQGIVYPDCPPYNADRSASDSSSEIQAFLDRLEESTPIGSAPRLCGYFKDVYTVTRGVVFDSGASTTANLCIRGTGNSGLICNYTGATRCLEIKGRAVINHVYVEGFNMRGGAARPDELLRITSAAQVTIRNSNLSDAQIYALRTSLAQHLTISSSIFHNNAVGKPGCFIYISNEDSRIAIVDNSFEGRTGSVTHAICLGGNSIESFVATANTHYADEIAGFLKLSQDTTLLGGIVANNSFLNVNAKAFDMGTGSGTRELTLMGNRFDGMPGSTHGFEISNWIDSVALGNTFKGFDFGMRLVGSTARVQVKNNLFDSDLTCFLQGSGSGTYVDTEVDGNSCSTAANSVVIGRGTSRGNNRLANWSLTDSTVRGLTTKWDLTGGYTLNTDTVTLANRVQIATCVDSGDGSPAALTAQPYNANFQVSNSDTNGCAVTLATADAEEGMRIVVTIDSSAGGSITVDGSTLTTIGAWTFQQGEWREEYAN